MSKHHDDDDLHEDEVYDDDDDVTKIYPLHGFTPTQMANIVVTVDRVRTLTRQMERVNKRLRDAEGKIDANSLMLSFSHKLLWFIGTAFAGLFISFLIERFFIG